MVHLTEQGLFLCPLALHILFLSYYSQNEDRQRRRDGSAP